jgi:hypothetical protein
MILSYTVKCETGFSPNNSDDFDPQFSIQLAPLQLVGSEALLLAWHTTREKYTM